jgi:hypothetical protein
MMTDKELIDNMERFMYVEVSSGTTSDLRVGMMWRQNDPYSKLTLREKLEQCCTRHKQPERTT